MIKVITSSGNEETTHTTFQGIALIPLYSVTCWRNSSYKVRLGKNVN